jgi:uncharacterized DUF497 family protein
VEFEFDSAKSMANLQKHGIDFVAAQALWSDPDRLEIPAAVIRRAAHSGDRAHRRPGVVGVRHAPRRADSHHLRQASSQ